MLIVHQIGPGVADYFLDGRHPGRWSAGANDLLGMDGPPGRADLRAVLQGRDPRTRAPLRSAPPRRRRSGWDLIFSTPKSVSLLGATGDGLAPAVTAAHEAAVDGLLRRVESDLTARDGRRPGALIAATFVHTTNSAGEPHLHSHVLVANLARVGDEWRAVDPYPWQVARTALNGLYDLALRHYLAVEGLDLDWRIRPDGLADLADIPRAAIRAASSQNRAAKELGRFEARRRAQPQPWRDRTSVAGLALPAAVADLGGAPSPAGRAYRAALPPPSDGRLRRAVTTRLASTRSDFRREDVLVALAACHPGGAAPDEALGWVDSFCREAVQVASPTAHPRWTTALARGVDDELVRSLRSLGASRAVPASAVEELAAGGVVAPELLAAVELLTADDSPAVFVGAEGGTSGFVDRAELLDACRSVWTSAGLTVEVCTPAPGRWEALTGIPAHQPRGVADVIVVDRADRRPTAELVRLVAGAGDRAAKLVFVEGGTLPRLSAPASAGLFEVAATGARVTCAPAPPWGLTAGGGDPVPGMLVGRAAAGRALRAWAATPGSVLVGLGVDEVAGLNLAACRAVRATGDPPGRAPGDRVVVLKRLPGLPPHGTFGTVDGAAGPPGTFAVTWDEGSGTTRIPVGTRAVAAGWAVSAWTASRIARPAVLLGAEKALGRRIERLVHSEEREPVAASRARTGRLVGY